MKTDETIQEYVATSMLSLLGTLSQEFKELEFSRQKENKLTALKDIGFTSSINYKNLEGEKNTIDKYNQQVQALRGGVTFLGNCFKYFGNDVKMISYNDFNTLRNKYNLYISLLNGYTGNIPEENLQEIIKVNKVLNKLDSYPSLNRHIKCVNCSWRSLLPTDDSFYELNDYKKQNYPKMFILAPLSEINNTSNEMERMRILDPLVCSYTDIGVLIYTAWGEEANDTVFEKYKELNNAIQKLTGKSIFSSPKAIKSENIASNVIFIICFLGIFTILSFLSPSLKSIYESMGIIGLILPATVTITAISLLLYSFYKYNK